MTNKIARFIFQKAPKTLVISSIIGVIGTGLLSYFAAKTDKKVLKITAAATGALTIGSILVNEGIRRKAIRNMGIAYSTLSAAYLAYQNKVIEHHGQDAHKKILEEIEIEKCTCTSPYATGIIGSSSLDWDDDEDTHLFYFKDIDTYFYSTKSQVMQAEYHFNRNFVLGCGGYLEELLDFLGLEYKPEYSGLLWTQESGLYWVDFNHYTFTKNGETVYGLEAVFSPEEVEDFAT